MRKIIVFVVDGCSACEEYKPRFYNIMKSNSIPSKVVNLLKTTDDMKQIAKAFDVYAFPTTVVINDDVAQVIEGNVSEERILNAIKVVFKK